MNKGAASIFIALTVAGGILVTLLTSKFINQGTPIVSNPRAISCPANQCAGTSSCYPIGHYDTTSQLTCCAAHANCTNTTYNWATWGGSCNCSGPTPTRTPTRTPTTRPGGPTSTRTPTPRPNLPTNTPPPGIINCSPNLRKQGASNLTCAQNICGSDQYVTNSQQVIGSTRYCCCRQVTTQSCCRNDGVGVAPCAANETKIRYVGDFTDNCASANNSYGNVSLCSVNGGPTSSGHICKPPPSPTPTRTRTPTRTPTRPATPTVVGACNQSTVGTCGSPACPAGKKCSSISSNNVVTYNCNTNCTSSPSATKTATPRPSPTSPTAQSCTLGNETYSLNQFQCDEVNNVVKECKGNNNWQQVVPNPCGSQKCTNDPVGHSYSCVQQCEGLSVKGTNKFKIALLPERFDSLSEFRSIANQALKHIEKTNLKSAGLLDKINFYLVTDLNIAYHTNYSNSYENIDFYKISDTGQNLCGANSSIVLDKLSRCSPFGGGNGGRAIPGLSSYVCGGLDTSTPHELGHSVGGLNDEYGNQNSPTDLLTWTGPNCTGDSSCSVWSGMPGIECLQGCGCGPDCKGLKNLYRPNEINIMRGREIFPESYDFDSPSLKAWQELLINY